MKKRWHSFTEQELVYECCDKWLEFTELINNTTGTEVLVSPPPPTEVDEIKYQRLRFWLIDHQAQFTPLWREFYRSHAWAQTASKNDEEGDLPQRYLENHFLFFYEPENLYELAKQLELQSGTDIWEPSETRACEMRPLLIGLGQLMIEFMDWIDRSTIESG